VLYRRGGIADFLKHTRRLRTLVYSHSTKYNREPRDWNIREFVTTIERVAGSHLIELSVSICEIHGSITPGKASMCGFQRLRKLELPFEIIMYDVTGAACEVGT